MHPKKLLMIGTRLSSVPFQEIRDLFRKRLKKSGLMKKVFGPRSGNLIQTKCLENASKRTGNARRSWTWSRTNRTKIKSKKSCIKTTEPSNWHTNTFPAGVHLATFGQFPTTHGHNFASRPKSSTKTPLWKSLTLHLSQQIQSQAPITKAILWFLKEDLWGFSLWNAWWDCRNKNTKSLGWLITFLTRLVWW